VEVTWDDNSRPQIARERNGDPLYETSTPPSSRAFLFVYCSKRGRMSMLRAGNTAVLSRLLPAEFLTLFECFPFFDNMGFIVTVFQELHLLPGS
jgi:hypothetical protein